MGLKAIQPKSFVPRTTDSRHGFRVSENLLKEIREIKEKCSVIVGDITYLPMQSGKFCYLATFQDKLTRRIVGWEISSSDDGRVGCRSVVDGTRDAVWLAKTR